MLEKIPESQEIIKHWNSLKKLPFPEAIGGFNRYLERVLDLKRRYEFQLKFLEKIVDIWMQCINAGGVEYQITADKFEKKLDVIKQDLAEEFKKELG